MNGAGTARLVVENACLRYGELAVLDDLSLTVGSAEIVSIVGPSGCGKTTLLRCVGGLNQLNGGEIRIEGQRVEKPLPSVSMVFQHFGLFPWRNLWNNIAYGLKLKHTPKDEIERRVDEAIELVGLKGFEKSYPHQLAGGMQQRAGLARALVMEPKLLLMDEPFSAIDAQTREQLQFELLRIWDARPSGIVTAIPGTIASAEFWGDVLVTLSSILEGVAIGSAAGILAGVAMGRVREINWFLSTYIRALYALPLIALVPIVILWVGYQPAARLVIVIISVFLPVAATTADGTRAIAKDYLDVGKMFGARTHNIWFGIALPSAMPHIVAGIELGFARGITNAIAVEVLASVPGMGMSVFTKSNELNENASLVYVVCLGIFAVSVRAGMIRFRHWLAPWYTRA